MNFTMNDYATVPERIAAFYKKYPDGSLQSWVPPYIIDANGKQFVVYSAAAYRTADDQRPGIGWAWEPIPGPTPFTKDSELMNAETSAWGRAIAALGFEVKKSVATQNEIQNRQPAPAAAKPATFTAPVPRGEKAGKAQKDRLEAMVAELETAGALSRTQLDSATKNINGKNFEDALKELTKDQAKNLIERLSKYQQALATA